jgi:hypothetical protein
LAAAPGFLAAAWAARNEVTPPVTKHAVGYTTHVMARSLIPKVDIAGALPQHSVRVFRQAG